MYEFFRKHPFTASLFRLSARIVVAWYTLALAVFLPLFFFLAAFVAAALFAGGEGEVPVMRSHVFGNEMSFNKLLSIKVDGIIEGESGSDDAGGLFALSGMTYGYDVKSQLYAAAKEEDVQGVVLEINSPGGTIYGSQAIADGVKYYRETTKKPVFAHVSGVAASGGYWAAVAADRVIADHGSIMGSIGVIMGPFKYYDGVISEDGGLFMGGVMTQNGIESTTLTAGKSKDIGDPTRRLTQEEIAVLQQGLNNEYDTFIQHVSMRRNIQPDVVRNQIKALVYDNKTAQQLRLIDQTGSREDAYYQLAKAAKLEGDDFAVVREETELGFLDSLLSASGLRDTQPKAAPAAPCTLNRVALAYHGSVADICSRR